MGKGNIMSKKLSVGDKVQCRLFNTPERKFYGEYFTATIVNIANQPKYSNVWYVEPYYKGYEVKREDGSNITLLRKEIIRRIN